MPTPCIERFANARPAARFAARFAAAVFVVMLLGCVAERSDGQASSGGRVMVDYSELTTAVAPPPDQRERYGDDVLQFGELRIPRNAHGRRPVVVLLHGGCWQAAYGLAYLASAADALAREGYVVWTPEYRRLGDDGGGWPGTFVDVARAVDHVRRLATTVPTVDTARVLLVGHSAGGALALWAASRGVHRDELPELAVASRSPLRVVGVVSLAGIADLPSYGAAPGGCNGAVTSLLKGTPKEVPERYHAVDPMQRLPLGVRVYLVHGSADPIVPVEQSERYAERARAARDSVAIAIIARAGHFDLAAPQSAAWPAVIAAIRALAPPTSVP